jgi:threonyl-tRNA synthetase
MRKINALYWLLILGIGFANAQTPKPEFHKTVDSINAIIKANHLAYYMVSKQYDAHITKISATEQGIISFTDSIPKPEIPTVTTKRELVSDCCPRKNSRTLDLFAVKKWNIHFPYVYLKDENNETFAKFLGFKKPDLEKLKEHLEKLKTLCKQEKIETKL